MREIEIRRSWQSPDSFTDTEEVVALSQEFMEVAFQDDDFRFLNTALKLNDWIRSYGTDPELVSEIEVAEEKSLRKLRERRGIEL